VAFHGPRIQPFSEITTVIGSFSIIACSMAARSATGLRERCGGAPSSVSLETSCGHCPNFPGDGLPLLGLEMRAGRRFHRAFSLTDLVFLADFDFFKLAQ
jgi:hypothetical protein